MKIHELKTLSKHYQDVVSNGKKAELRKHDRDYKVGDLLLLRECDKPCGDDDYTGLEKYVKITHILKGEGKYGLQEGYSMLSIEPLSFEELTNIIRKRNLKRRGEK